VLRRLAAVDLFVPIRQLFWMGEWANNADVWGLRHRMTDRFYDERRGAAPGLGWRREDRL
jgi:hypothetical protein